MHNRIAGPPRVRDGHSPYGDPPPPAEPFEARGVLLDLPAAEDGDIPLILARFAALRAWALWARGGAAGRHARSAALDHLDTVGPDWEEGRLLRRLLDSGEQAVELLDAAAGRAAARGHEAGARTLRQTAHRLRWRSARFPPPSTS